MSHESHSAGSDHHGSDPHSDAPGHDQGHGGVGKYLVVFAALCVLTAISFGVGNSKTIMSNKEVGWSLMMAVSCAKAMLVIMFFMHLLWEANWKYVLTIPASIMSLFLILMLIPDVGQRTRTYSEERLLYAATPEEPTDEHGGNVNFDEKQQPHDQDASGAPTH